MKRKATIISAVSGVANLIVALIVASNQIVGFDRVSRGYEIVSILLITVPFVVIPLILATLSYLNIILGKNKKKRRFKFAVLLVSIGPLLFLAYYFIVVLWWGLGHSGEAPLSLFEWIQRLLYFN